MAKTKTDKIRVVEEFYSLQGEGFNMGKPAWFIRLGGCEVGCSFCDEMRAWDASRYPEVEIDEIVNHALNCPAKAVVVTGGEPMLYDLTNLCNKFHEHNIQCFLETSGSQPITGDWDWICLSPKYGAAPNNETLAKANELKIIIGCKEDFEWAEKNSKLVSDKCILFLQPDWNRCNVIIKDIVDYILINPKWRLSLQTHKYIQIL